jgi:hypothetical protein
MRSNWKLKIKKGPKCFTLSRYQKTALSVLVICLLGASLHAVQFYADLYYKFSHGFHSQSDPVLLTAR